MKLTLVYSVFLIGFSFSAFSQTSEQVFIDVSEKEKKMSREEREFFEKVEIVFKTNKEEYIEGEPGYFTIEIINNSRKNYTWGDLPMILKENMGEPRQYSKASNAANQETRSYVDLTTKKGGKVAFEFNDGGEMREIKNKQKKNKNEFLSDITLKSGDVKTFYGFFKITFDGISKKAPSMVVVPENEKNFSLYVLSGKKCTGLYNESERKRYLLITPFEKELKLLPYNEEKLGEMIKDLKSKAEGDLDDIETKIAIMQILLFYHQEAMPLFLQWFQSDNAYLAKRSVIAIAKTGGEEAVQKIKEILSKRNLVDENAKEGFRYGEYKDSYVKVMILDELVRKMGDKPNPEVLLCLYAVKNDPSIQVRREVVSLAGSIYVKYKMDDALNLIREMESDPKEEISNFARNTLSSFEKK